jgi:hypothetical protein
VGVRVVHRPADATEEGVAAGIEERVLAREVDVADSLFSRMRGLMFRPGVPDDYALAFRFADPGDRSLHMLFVPFDIDAVWVVGDEVTGVRRLPAWRGLGRGTADLILELPAGAAEGVEPGDTVELVE